MFSLLPSCPHLATLSNKHSKSISKALLIEGTQPDRDSACPHFEKHHATTEGLIACIPRGEGDLKQKGQIIEEVWLINAVGSETLQEQTNTHSWNMIQ